MSDPFGLGAALAFDLHEPTDPMTGDWRPLTTRISATMLRQRVDHVRDALTPEGQEPVDARTAASTEQFGLVARLVAAHICAGALGLHLDLCTDSIRWRIDDTSWLQLSFATTDVPVNPLQHTAIASLTRRIEKLYGVSARVLWGNVGSAANSTISLLGRTRPDLVEKARRSADELLADERIDGGALHVGPGFRRASCCLVYRAAIGLCGDCVLQRRETPRS